MTGDVHYIQSAYFGSGKCSECSVASEVYDGRDGIRQLAGWLRAISCSSRRPEMQPIVERVLELV